MGHIRKIILPHQDLKMNLHRTIYGFILYLIIEEELYPWFQLFLRTSPFLPALYHSYLHGNVTTIFFIYTYLSYIIILTAVVSLLDLPKHMILLKLCLISTIVVAAL